jgi:FHA domain-containing protein
MIKCSECGYENMDGLDYCDGCGAKLNAAAASEHAGAGAGGAGASAPAASAAPSGEAAAAAAPAAESTPAAAHTDGGAAADGGTAAAETPASQPAPSSEAPTGEIQKPAEAPPTAEPQPAAAAAATFKAKLSIIRGGRKGQEFELEAGNNQIGRWDPETGAFPEVDLDQDDPEAKVSRKHALVRIDSGKITVEDTGSLNGTYVNRQPRLIPGTPIELKNGDEIIIGKTFLRLVVEPIS